MGRDLPLVFSWNCRFLETGSFSVYQIAHGARGAQLGFVPAIRIPFTPSRSSCIHRSWGFVTTFIVYKNLAMSIGLVLKILDVIVDIAR